MKRFVLPLIICLSLLSCPVHAAFDKTKPAGSDTFGQSDDYIRANNEALETAIGQDHDFTTGGTQTGTHDQVTFTAPISTPTPAASTGVLYIKDVSGKAELHFCDEDGNEIQLTTGGVLRALAAAGITASASEINSALDGITATYAEINRACDGITAAATEINAACDGITANASEINRACDGITATAAEINDACDGSYARNGHVHSNISITGDAGIEVNRSNLGGNLSISHAAHTGDVTGTTALTIANSAVSQAKLKTSSGSISRSAAGGASYTLPGGEYGFWPRHRQSGDICYNLYLWSSGIGAGPASYTSTIFLEYVSGMGTIYVSQRYVTSSGEVHWIFVLRDKATKEIISIWQAPDHPCFGNGGDPARKAHPFIGYDEAEQEIIVINPSKALVNEIREKSIGKDFIDVILEEYEIDEESSPEWPTIPVTVGLPEGHDWLNMNEEVAPIKKTIQQPACVKVRSLKPKQR